MSGDKHLHETSQRAAQVLVVDDEPAIVAIYKRILTAEGFVVETATNGRVACEHVERRSFDVIVSDLSMPEMDGLSLLRKVREKDLDVPVILITGAPSIETAQGAIEFGALRYLCKPLQLEELVSVVKKAAMLMRLARIKRQALEHLGNVDLNVGDRAGLEVTFDRSLRGMWMAYQPIVRYSARAIYAYEALLRSSDPALPHPGALLGAAERLGRLTELGRRVRLNVANTVFNASDVRDVFINLHPRDLLDDDLFAANAPLSQIASRVVLEITERASLDDIRDVPNCVRRLRDLGFRVAVDDIGAGYAGLTSVANLQPEVMKIDMALVRGIDSDTTKQKLVRAMVSLCQDMDVAVIAEGIETPAERDTVVELGCDLLQGYLFGKPALPFASALVA